MAEFINTVDVIGDDALMDSLITRTITEFKDNVIISIADRVFDSCVDLVTVDVPNITSIGQLVFSGCNALSAFILRNETTVPTLRWNSTFNNSGISAGTGYIYVPAALVASYKTATNWSTHAAQIRALEDYTVDGTTTGALDESKI